jgi:hypothetical protein
MTKLASLIAAREGFFKSGTLPRRRHNPGDLRHSPHSSHEGIGPNDIGEIDTDEHGWEDLERQLDLDAARGMTLEAAIYSWAPQCENDSAGYLRFVLEGLAGQAGPETPLRDVLKIAA